MSAAVGRRQVLLYRVRGGSPSPRRRHSTYQCARWHSPNDYRGRTVSVTSWGVPMANTCATNARLPVINVIPSHRNRLLLLYVTNPATKGIAERRLRPGIRIPRHQRPLLGAGQRPVVLREPLRLEDSYRLPLVAQDADLDGVVIEFGFIE